MMDDAVVQIGGEETKKGHSKYRNGAINRSLTGTIDAGRGRTPDCAGMRHGAGHLGPVEVRQWERNFEGGWFAGVAVARDAERRLVLVRYSTLVAGEALEAWAPEACVRPVPPPAPAEFWANVHDGAALELCRGGGFWLVRLDGIQRRDDRTVGSTVYTVREAYGGTVRVAGLHALRPAWCWRAPAAACAQQVLAGSSVVPTPQRDWVMPRRFDDALEIDLECTPDGVAEWEGGEARGGARPGDSVDTARLPSLASSDGMGSDNGATAASLSMGAGGIVEGSERWLRLGSEVEYTDVGDGPFAGSWTAGEVIELRGTWDPAREYHAAPPAEVVVRSRIVCAAGPYTAGGLILLTQHAPLATVRPRPPPPPAEFLRVARPGMPLQLRWQGAWWDVQLREVQMRQVETQPQGDTPPAVCDVGASGRSDGGELSGVAGAGCVATAAEATASADGLLVGVAQAPAASGCTSVSCAGLVPRYVVASPTCDDVCGRVAASMLRPAWRWDGNGWWTAAAADAVGAGEGGVVGARGGETVGVGDVTMVDAAGKTMEEECPAAKGEVSLYADSAAQTACSLGPPPLRDEPPGSSPSASSLAAVRPSAGLMRGMAPSEAVGARVRVWVASGCTAPEQWGHRTDHHCDGGGASDDGVSCAGRGEAGGGRVMGWQRVSAVVGTVLGCDAERGLAVRIGGAPGVLVWVGLAAAWEWVPEDVPSPAECAAAEARLACRGVGLGGSAGDGAADEACYGQDGAAGPSFDGDCGLFCGARAARASESGSALSPSRAAFGLAPKPASGGAKKRRAAHPVVWDTSVLLHPGRRVELWGREEGFFGSWYEAEVLDIQKDKARSPLAWPPAHT